MKRFIVCSADGIIYISIQDLKAVDRLCPHVYLWVSECKAARIIDTTGDPVFTLTCRRVLR